MINYHILIFGHLGLFTSGALKKGSLKNLINMTKFFAER